MSFNAFVLAGTHSGAGKTTISSGILGALKKRGRRVQPFKTGPDYIDPAFHAFITGVKSKNLDTWMLSKDTIQYLFSKNVRSADTAVVEGVMGFFDGMGSTMDEGSTAYLAKILNLPVILIVDGSGMARSAAAIVKGYASFDPDIRIAGVIVNRVGSEHHYEIIKEAIEHYTGIPCVGYVKKNQEVGLSSRHLGLVPAGEVESLNEKLDTVVQMIEETVDLDRLIELTVQEKPAPLVHETEKRNGSYSHIQIGVALDQSFNFYYWDNIELMETLGAKITYFSPMKDKKLPENLDWLYFGGGFPEVFASELSANQSFLESMKNYVGSGRPIYAECGGLMYLTESIKDLEGHLHPMTGIVKGQTHMTKTLKHFGYNEVHTKPQATGKCYIFKAHEFHRSEMVGAEQDRAYCLYKYKDTDKEKQWQCGYQVGNVLGAYAHVHFYSEPEWLYYWLDLASRIKEKRHESI